MSAANGDVVVRLRAAAERSFFALPAPEECGIEADAADEIEQLRKALQAVHQGLVVALGDPLGMRPGSVMSLEAIARHALSGRSGGEAS